MKLIIRKLGFNLALFALALYALVERGVASNKGDVKNSSAVKSFSDRFTLKHSKALRLPSIDTLMVQNTRKKLNIANPLTRFGQKSSLEPAGQALRLKEEDDTKMNNSQREEHTVAMARTSLNSTDKSDAELSTLKLKNLFKSNNHRREKREIDHNGSSVTPTPGADSPADAKSGAASQAQASEDRNASSKIKSDLKSESKNFGEGERNVVAETSGLASVGDDISISTLNSLKLKAPKIVPSFTYEDAKIEGNPVQEADSKAENSKEIYYNPRGGVLGDIKICSNIQDPYFCVKQNVCGWCGEYNICIAGNNLKPLQPCSVATYTYTSYLGWNPQVITIAS